MFNGVAASLRRGQRGAGPRPGPGCGGVPSSPPSIRRPGARSCSTSPPARGPRACPSPSSGRHRDPVRLFTRDAGLVGHERPRPGLPFTAGDALTGLPFADASFDAATISFGLRNVVDLIDVALSQLFRVVRPGGRLVICEFSHPHWGDRCARRTPSTSWGCHPGVARRVASNPDAYVYLAESIAAWPNQAELAKRITGRRLVRRLEWRDLHGGIVAVHRATR